MSRFHVYLIRLPSQRELLFNRRNAQLHDKCPRENHGAKELENEVRRFVPFRKRELAGEIKPGDRRAQETFFHDQDSWRKGKASLVIEREIFPWKDPGATGEKKKKKKGKSAEMKGAFFNPVFFKNVKFLWPVNVNFLEAAHRRRGRVELFRGVVRTLSLTI